MSKKRIFNFCCAVLMLLLLVLQFSPFWHYGDPEQTASVQNFLWFPSEHSGVESYVREQTGNSDFSVGDVVAMPLLVLILGAVGIVLCCFKNQSVFTLLLPLAAGIVGFIGYLSHPAFRLGSNWVLHLLVCIVLAAVSAYGLFSGMKPEQKQA